MKSLMDQNDTEIMADWYSFAAEQPGFVGFALRLLREKKGFSLEDQRKELGADEVTFMRLQAMPLPRETSVVRDSHRIAEVVGLANMFAFVNAMTLFRQIESATGQAATSVEGVYEAAFDEQSDLDEVEGERQ